jgi:hypothetical protein
MRTSLLIAILLHLTMLSVAKQQCPPAYSSEQDQPTICTYYEHYDHGSSAVNADYEKIANIWEESWSKNGWRTLILTRKDAISHPRYEDTIADLEMLPTVNDKTYELSCYLRWFAAVQAGCGDF